MLMSSMVLLSGVCLLTGCSSETLHVDLEGAGPFALDVGPCVQLASAGRLRNDEAPVNNITVTVTSADQRIDGDVYYDVTGETRAQAGGLVTYAWSCVVHVDLSGQRLDAEMTEFTSIGE